MPGRKAKSIHLIKAEGNKRHLTKKEIEVREKAEKENFTGRVMQPDEFVKKYPEALKIFNRIKGLFKLIKKDDAIYELAINKYCVLKADSDKLYIQRDQHEIVSEEWARIDKMIMEKQKAMIGIEKENLMTINSVLRAVPKNQDKEKQVDPMAALLNGVM